MIGANTTRNLDVYKRMDDYLIKNPNIDTIIGHSAGGAAALEKARHDKRYSTITYNSPTFDTDMFTKHNVVRRTNRFSNMFDPISIVDFGARRNFIPGFNPHSYNNAPRRNNNFFNNDFVSYRTKRNKF